MSLRDSHACASATNQNRQNFVSTSATVNNHQKSRSAMISDSDRSSAYSDQIQKKMIFVIIAIRHHDMSLHVLTMSRQTCLYPYLGCTDSTVLYCVLICTLCTCTLTDYMKAVGSLPTRTVQTVHTYCRYVVVQFLTN